jgi:hypothetical protein
MAWAINNRANLPTILLGVQSEHGVNQYSNNKETPCKFSLPVVRVSRDRDGGMFLAANPLSNKLCSILIGICRPARGLRSC